MNHIAHNILDGAKCALFDWSHFSQLDGWGKFSFVACNVSLAVACAAGGIALPTAAIGYGVMLGAHGAHGLYCHFHRSIGERRVEVPAAPARTPTPAFQDDTDLAAIEPSSTDQPRPQAPADGAGTSASQATDGVREPIPEIVEQVLQGDANPAAERAAIRARLGAAVREERWADAALAALNMSAQVELPAEKADWLLLAVKNHLQAKESDNAKDHCVELLNDYWAELTEEQKGQCVEFYAQCNLTEDDIQALRNDDTVKDAIRASVTERQRQARLRHFGQQ